MLGLGLKPEKQCQCPWLINKNVEHGHTWTKNRVVSLVSVEARET